MRVLLVPNTANARALAAAGELATWLSASGFVPILTAEDAEASGLDGFAVPRSELGAPSLVVALGGDGTILKAAHVLGDTEAPILGVNFGRLGFLSGARIEHMREAVESALAAEARLERRVTLGVDVIMDGRTMRAGAVGALTGVKTPSKVAKLVMERTDRVFLVGAGARRFATAHGFPDEELLTEKTRKIWLYWKENLSAKDKWIEPDEEHLDPVCPFSGDETPRSGLCHGR